MKKLLTFVTLGIFLAAAPQMAYAAMYDLTGVGDSENINGALLSQEDPAGSTGTGVISSFVKYGANTDEVEAYNTTVNNVLDNGSSDQFNHEITLDNIPTLDIDGTVYREFLLDINQEGNDSLISLDEVQIFISDTPNQSVETFTGGMLDLADATLIYDLDADEDNWVALDANLASGSGDGDMFLYIESSLFGTDGSKYVYLYSKFGSQGGDYVNNDGFEEWAVRICNDDTGELVCDNPPPPNPPPVIPEPTTALLFGTGLAGAFIRKKILS